MIGREFIWLFLLNVALRKIENYAIAAISIEPYLIKLIIWIFTLNVLYYFVSLHESTTESWSNHYYWTHSIKSVQKHDTFKCRFHHQV